MEADTDVRDYTLALEEARRGVDAQDAARANIRERAGNLLGFAGLVASFFGGLAVRNDTEISLFLGLATVMFVLTAVAALSILVPRVVYTTMEPGTLVSWAEGSNPDPERMKRSLALWLGKQYDKNTGLLKRHHKMYTVGVGFLALEILFLILSLGGS
jgi:hypothetical protein